MDNASDAGVSAQEGTRDESDRSSGTLVFAKWLRRAGYAGLLGLVAWMAFYSFASEQLYRSGAEEAASRLIIVGRDVSDVLLKVATGCIAFGILIPIGERLRNQQAKS